VVLLVNQLAGLVFKGVLKRASCGLGEGKKKGAEREGQKVGREKRWKLPVVRGEGAEKENVGEKYLVGRV